MTLVHHVHRDHYVTELGRAGRGGGAGRRDAAAEAALRRRAVPDDLRGGRARPRGARDRRRTSHVGYLGVVPFAGAAAARSRDAAAALSRAAEALQADRAAARRASRRPGRRARHRRRGRSPAGRWRPRSRARGLGDRVVLHGHVVRGRRRRRCTRSAWVNLTASSAEGWCLTVMEAATCGDAERGAARRRAAGVDRGRRDRAAGRRRAGADRGGAAAGRRRRAARADGRGGAGAGARRSRGSARRARRWTLLEARRGRATAVRCATRWRARRRSKAAGMAAATMATNAIALLFTVLFARLLGAERLRLAGRAGLDVPDPGRARARRCRSRWRARSRSGRLGYGRAAGGDARRAGGGDCWSAGVAVTAVAVLLREPIADLISVPEAWAAAATAPDRRACGCCCRSSAARCRACTPTSRSAWSIVLEASGPARLRARAGRRRAGRDRRLPRHAAVAAGRPRSGCGGSAAPARARRRRRRATRRLRDLVGGAWPAVLGAVPARGAAERRRDPGQAPDRRRRGGRLRGGRGGGQGRRVGRDRDRAVPAARGDARRAHGRGPAAGAGARAGRRGARSRCRC